GAQNKPSLNIYYSVPVGIYDDNSQLPTDHKLNQNYPNPFNPTTTIEYSLSSRSHVMISIYNLLGQHVRTLVDEEKRLGSYSVTWDGLNSAGNPVSSGIYLYRLRAGDYVESKKMSLLK
ncbi:MAG: T9SS type A sorting domain-containing protein, partial [candidate division Zixibacteria bacterium]|nr:T9SS type A sorting domain-containing protein [candidate division Zixibacteria bacterium]